MMYPLCNGNRDTLFADLFNWLDLDSSEIEYPIYFESVNTKDSNYIKSLVKSDLSFNNYIDDKENYIVSFALAGVDKESISIEHDSDNIYVVVKGIPTNKEDGNTDSNTDKKIAYLHKGIKLPKSKDEKSTILIPTEYDVTKMTATYKDGLLTICMPRKEEAKTVKVTIK